MVYTLITGANRGLGLACLNHFKQLGHNVISLAGRKDCDFNNLKSVDALARDISKKYQIDNIIHCAGGGLGCKDLLPDWKDIEKVYRVNLIAPAILNRYIIPTMRERNTGTIIHISSTSGRFHNSSIIYSTIKSAIITYVRILGNSLASDNVMVCGLIPGTFIAEGNNWDRYTKIKATFLEEFINLNCPKKRLGRVEEIIPLIDFLLSNKTRMFNGCCIPIDGGEGRSFP